MLSAEAADPAHPAHDYFVRRYARIRSGTAEALRDVRAAGYLAPHVDEDRAAASLTALMDGTQLQWLLDPESVDMAEIVRLRIEELLVVSLMEGA